MLQLFCFVVSCFLLVVYSPVGARPPPFQHQRAQQPFGAVSPAGAPSLPFSLSLKTVYHHATSQSAHPGLFRRKDIHPALAPEVHTLDATLASFRRPSALAKQRLFESAPFSVASYEARRIRWEPLAVYGHDLWMESAFDLVPDIGNHDTVLALAIMMNNAYSDVDNTTDWYDLGTPWQLNTSFGWESDGIRGHVFANHDDSLLVISFKGTSAGVWTGGPTGEKDKLNDNMLFSCCCARISRAWTPVCDCYQGNTYYCESHCLEKSIKNTELYYDNAMAIYLDVAEKYPNSTIWLVGHSLGGALASLVGQTYGVPTVAFESPSDRLASRRLHLPRMDDLPLWHFGHTADPIFMGICNGPASICWYGGFAMESTCHAGKVCIWDTVNDKGWRVDSRSHRIKDVIDNILNKTDEFPLLPECLKQEHCSDCAQWTYYDERDGPMPTGEPTTTATMSSSSASL